MNVTALAAPDAETSSEGYARRFSGRAGRFLLARQQAVVERLLADKVGASILEVGGGHAQLCGAMISAGHHVTVLGSVPPHETRLGSDPRNLGVRYVKGDLMSLPFEDDSFDTVIAIRLMAHVDDWPRLLLEMCRVGRSTILIDYPVFASTNALSLLTFGIKKKIEGDTRHYRNFWTRDVAAEIRRHGMRVTGLKRQFTLPMALHRMAGGAPALQAVERFLATIGLTYLIGNPAILRADAAAEAR